MAREALANLRPDSTSILLRDISSDKEFSSRVVYQAAVQGDATAQDIYHKVGHALGITVADLINAFNLNMYVIGGGVASAWEAFAPSMMEEIKKRSFVYRNTGPDAKNNLGPKKTTIVTRALMGTDAGLFGAARLPMLGSEVVEHAH
jgi:glucokinase